MVLTGIVKAFLSYSTQEESFVRSLFDSLLTVGAGPYVAEWDDRSGESLATKIENNISDCVCFVVLLTESSNSSSWVHEEIGFAQALKKPIIPVVERGVRIRGFLEGKEWIQFEKYNFDYTIYRIINRVRNVVYLPAVLPLPNILPPIRSLDTVYAKCKTCLGEFTIALPSQEDINEAVSSNKILEAMCPNGHKNKLKCTTFQSI